MPVDYNLGESGPNDAPPGNEPGANPQVIQAKAPSGGSQQSGGGVNPWAGILATLGGVLLGNYFRGRSQDNAVPPELRQMLTMSNQRMAFQNPEFEAVTRGTYSMLPGFAREGTQLSGSLSNQVPAAPPTESGGSNPLTSLNPLTNPLLSGALGALLGRLGSGSGGDFPLGDIGRAIANLFRRGDRNPFGGRETVTGINDHSLPSYDPFGYGFDGLPGFSGLPSDPSQGTGVGPGMQGYRDEFGYPIDPFAGLPGYGTGLPGIDPSYFEPGGPMFTGPMLPGGNGSVNPDNNEFA